MPEQLTPEELQAMSPEQQQEHQQRQLRERKWCHRSFNPTLVMAQRRSALAPDQVGAPVPLTMNNNQLCEQENCMLWDVKKHRCLDRSAAIAAAYGKDEAGKQES